MDPDLPYMDHQTDQVFIYETRSGSSIQRQLCTVYPPTIRGIALAEDLAFLALAPEYRDIFLFQKFACLDIIRKQPNPRHILRVKVEGQGQLRS
jgi:hypothetical protein